MRTICVAIAVCACVPSNSSAAPNWQKTTYYSVEVEYWYWHPPFNPQWVTVFESTDPDVTLAEFYDIYFHKLAGNLQDAVPQYQYWVPVDVRLRIRHVWKPTQLPDSPPGPEAPPSGITRGRASR